VRVLRRIRNVIVRQRAQSFITDGSRYNIDGD
jgi:hypothetical protein